MRLFKYVLLGLNPSSYMDIRAEAKRQNVSVNTLIRLAVQRYVSDSGSLLNQPLVSWTPDEQRFADKVLRVHFEEDR
jgi:hypothetical protein